MTGLRGRLLAPASAFCDNGRLLSKSPSTAKRPLTFGTTPRSSAPAIATFAHHGFRRPSLKVFSQRADCATTTQDEKKGKFGIQGVHHIALIVDDLERSLDFYCNVLGLSVNADRPHDKLPYEGAWLWIGPEMIHLMELPNPDPMEGRPTHGGRDRHFCVGVDSVAPIIAQLEGAGIDYTASKSGRPAIFFRDPDMNTIECVEIEPWRPCL